MDQGDDGHDRNDYKKHHDDDHVYYVSQGDECHERDDQGAQDDGDDHVVHQQEAGPLPHGRLSRPDWRAELRRPRLHRQLWQVRDHLGWNYDRHGDHIDQQDHRDHQDLN